MILEQARRVVHDILIVWGVVGGAFFAFAFAGLLEDRLHGSRHRARRRAQLSSPPQCARRPCPTRARTTRRPPLPARHARHTGRVS